MKKHLFWSVPVLSLALMACSPASEPEPEEPAASEDDTGETTGGETEDGSKSLSQIKSVQQQTEVEDEAVEETDKPVADDTDTGRIAEPVASSETAEESKPIDLLDEPVTDGETGEEETDQEPQR